MKRNRRANTTYHRSTNSKAKRRVRTKKSVGRSVAISRKKEPVKEELDHTEEEDDGYISMGSPTAVQFQFRKENTCTTDRKSPSPVVPSRRSLGSELINANRHTKSKRKASGHSKAFTTAVNASAGNTEKKKAKKSVPRVAPSGTRRNPRRGGSDPKAVFRAAKMQARKFCGDTEYWDKVKADAKERRVLQEEADLAIIDEQPIAIPVGREREYSQVYALCSQLVVSKKGGVTYLYGAPGSGKTFTLTIVKHNIQLEYGNRLRFFHSNFHVQGATVPDNLSSMKPTVFWIDEMDRGHTAVIQELLKIAAKRPLLIIGVGNGPRFLMNNRNVVRLPFDVYTKEAIKTVILQKYHSSLFARGAKELVSARVANETGDIRTALSVLSSAISSAPEGCPVTLKMVFTVLKNTPNTPTSISTSLKCLVPHARLVLCAAVRLGGSDISHSQLEREYRIVCEKKMLRPETSDFSTLRDSLLDVLVPQNKATLCIKIDIDAIRLAMPEHSDILMK